MILGVLAGIAIPAFTSQREKGQDAEAKENAANLAKIVHSCYIERLDYTQCRHADVEAIEPTGLQLGAGSGRVEATNPASDEMVVIAHSKSGGDFQIRVAPPSNAAVRSCTGSTAGCKSGAW